MRFVMRGGRVTAGRAEGTAGWAEEKKTTIISGCFQELPHTPAPAPSNRLLPGDRCTPRPEMCSCSSSWRRCLFLSKVPKQASQHRSCRTWAENSSVKWGDISSSWKLEEVRSTFRRSSVEHLAWWMIVILINTQHTAYKYMNNTGDRVKTRVAFWKSVFLQWTTGCAAAAGCNNISIFSCCVFQLRLLEYVLTVSFMEWNASQD